MTLPTLTVGSVIPFLSHELHARREKTLAVLTEWVEVICRNEECLHQFRTRVRGRKTTCPVCRRGRYVGKKQQPEWVDKNAPVKKPGVPMTCKHCNYEWS